MVSFKSCFILSEPISTRPLAAELLELRVETSSEKAAFNMTKRNCWTSFRKLRKHKETHVPSAWSLLDIVWYCSYNCSSGIICSVRSVRSGALSMLRHSPLRSPASSCAPITCFWLCISFAYQNRFRIYQNHWTLLVKIIKFQTLWNLQHLLLDATIKLSYINMLKLVKLC